ncbi:MAG: copper-translocating P-type ATPase [Caldilinea sp.]|nr:MAG: copper-translocating P-type ATPase [Caldilinea sp.]
MDHPNHSESMPATHAAHSSHPASASFDHAQAMHKPDDQGMSQAAPKVHKMHIDHTGHEALFRRRFWWCLALSIPVILYDEMVQQWLKLTVPNFPGSEWVPLTFSVIIFGYGGVPFLRMAIPELRTRKPGMMALISLAISIAFIYSLVVELGGFGKSFFWEQVTLIDVMLLGHWLEMRSVRQASSALDELARLLPDTAERIRQDGSVETVSVASLRIGDLLLIRPGASIPADGEIIEGESTVNEAMLTGESKPVKKRTGDKVIAGTINSDGSLRVRVTATGDKTALAGIMRLVEQAQQSKSRTQVLSDRAAGWLFYIALLVAALTAVGWTLATGFHWETIEKVVTVLVISCPHALGLAVPLVVAITTSLSAANGILVRNRLALEAARNLDVVIFDKTGTLTEGRFGVTGVRTVNGWTEEEALIFAAAAEGDSEHLIAQAIRAEAQARKLTLPPVSRFAALKGKGVQASVADRTVFVGGPQLLESLSVDVPEALRAFAAEAGKKAQSAIYLIVEGQAVAVFSVADVIRPESKEAVDSLRQMGFEIAMITGDSRAVAEAVAAELQIDYVFAEVLPENKVQIVMEFQHRRKRVAMVGDGVNDAPALVQADVGVAVGAGTDVAIESAGIILVKSNPLDVVKMIALSRASHRKMVENLWWAAGYNVIALPLAAGALAPWGIHLTPALGAGFMSLSTIIVALNAQLLRRNRVFRR